MKKLLTLSFILSMFIFASCEKTETFDDTRKIDNETQFAKVTAKVGEYAEYKKIESKTGAGHIMYKVIKEGDSDIRPLFNDEVKVLYTGWYKRFWTKEDEFTGDDGNPFKNKVIFDSTENRGNVPSKFAVNGTVDGFSTALQHMNVGDKWEIWMPWNLGYGAYDNTNSGIPGYTTLVFEVELKEVVGRK